MDPKEQFDKQAKHYSSSKTFSSGQGLKILTNLLKGKKFNNGLDIGTGAGFAAFELSKVCRNVEATDISEGMINEAKKIMKERKIKNLNFNLMPAEELNFNDGNFDIITCRTAAHHFNNVTKFCNESNRVLKIESEAIIIDTITSDQKKLNKWHQEVELIRDNSHKNNLSLMEWKEVFKETEFRVLDIMQTRVEMNLSDWMERSGTLDKDKIILKKKFLESDDKLKEFFGIKLKDDDDLSFFWPVGIFHLKKLN
ncbi:MAG: class I SAM-dependent methyltransferase [Dehalococcoidia bacterium]|tara:strand:- start:778 stop:1539 length:762 start_codon:yes stop_codon:yes gene_type:complete